MSYGKFGESELYNNVTGKDKLQDKIVDKINNSLQFQLTEKKTLSKRIKNSKNRVKFMEKNLNVSKTEIKRLREEAE